MKPPRIISRATLRSYALALGSNSHAARALAMYDALKADGAKVRIEAHHTGWVIDEPNGRSYFL